MSRTRSYAKATTNGTWKRFGSTFGGNQVVYEAGTCTDTPGKGLGDMLPFQVDKDILQGGVINNIVKDGGSYFRPYFDNYTADAMTFSGRPVFPLILSYPGELSSSAYAAAAIARTSPNRPDVDLVQNLLEIRDIPRVLMLRVKSLLSIPANEYLRLQFGIKPLIKDIKRTLNWAELVHKRLDTINKLRTTGGFRKTVTLDKLSASVVNSNIYFQSSGCTFVDTFETVGKRTIRGHVRYFPTTDYNKYGQREMLAMAKRAVFGVEVSLSGLWEGMPWSWLIDWYTNIGDLLMQTRNTIPVSVQSLALMRSTESVSVTHAMSNGEQKISAAIVTKSRKERYSASATLDAHLPLLEADQMGILASLLVMKGSSPYHG